MLNSSKFQPPAASGTLFNLFLLFVAFVVFDDKSTTTTMGVIVQSGNDKSEGQICIEKTNELHYGNKELDEARGDYRRSVKIEMKAKGFNKKKEIPMHAYYPDDKLIEYESVCTNLTKKKRSSSEKKGEEDASVFRKIERDVFDCVMTKEMAIGEPEKYELTIHNFAICLSSAPECEKFKADRMMEYVFDKLDLVCELDDYETEKNDNNSVITTTSQTKEPPEYVSKDGGFHTPMWSILFVITAVCGLVYFVYYHNRNTTSSNAVFQLPIGSSFRSASHQLLSSDANDATANEIDDDFGLQLSSPTSSIVSSC